MADWVSAGCASLAILTTCLALRLKKRGDQKTLTESKAQKYVAGLKERISVVEPLRLDAGTQKRIVDLSVASLHEAIERREFSCVEVVSAYVAQVQERAMDLHAISDERLTAALRDAAALDTALAQGATPGPLFGIPFSIKDNISHHDFCTSHGLAQLCYNRLSSDSVIIKALQKQGAIPLVRGTMAQLGASSTTENCLTGVCENPLRKGRSAGGSSGGESALVSSHCVMFGLGGDIGGSVRTPASFTGLVSLRPTSTRVSSAGPVRKGGWPGLASSWGPLTRDVEGLERVMEVLASAEVHREDPIIAPIVWKKCSPKKLRIGYIKNDEFAPLCAAAQRALTESVAHLTSAGHELCEFHVPDMRGGYSLFLRFFQCSIANLEAFFDKETPINTLKRSFHRRNIPGVIRRILHWWTCTEKDPLPSAPYGPVPEHPFLVAELTAALATYRQTFFRAWQEADIEALIAPFPVPAGPHGFMFDEARALIWTALFNVVDCPAGTVPVTRVREEECTYEGSSQEETRRLTEILTGAEGLPISVQVVTKPYADELCVALMRQLEERIRL